jgi:hypothetical protein
MHDGPTLRQAYALLLPAARPQVIYQAQRALRNAVPVGAVLGEPTWDAENALIRLQEDYLDHEILLGDTPEPERAAIAPFTIPPAELPILLDLARRVRRALDEALGPGPHLVPRGPLGARIVEDAQGSEPVFEIWPDGDAGLAHDRISLWDLLDTLDALIPALGQAIADGIPVAMIEDQGWHADEDPS